MSYAKIQDGSIIKYPYTFFDLKKDNPNVSFPKDFFEREGEFADFNVVKIIVSDKPSKEGRVPVEETPSVKDGTWSQNWKLVPKDTSDGRSEAEEVQWTEGAYDRAMVDLRSRRNQLLASSDWTQVADVALTVEEDTSWRDYRKALRDLPAGLRTADDVASVVWPTV